jgi:type 1 glutamine amidotransferase
MWSIPTVVAAVLGAALIPPGFEHGATLRVYEIGMPMESLVELVPGQTPNVDRLIGTVDLDGAEAFGGLGDLFAAEVIGSLWIDEPGRYGFALESDDGSRLTIDGAVVIDNDGLHSATRAEGSAELTPGAHPFRIAYFENAGDQTLRLEWKPLGGGWAVVPEEALITEAGVTRVTAPGGKRIMGPAGELRPGWGMPLDRVHPAFTVTTIRPEGFEPQVGGMALAPDGTLYVATFPPNQNGWLDGLRIVADGAVWAIDDPTLPREQIRVRKVAEGLHEPAGLAVGPDGTVYVSQRYELTKLLDRDGDGFFETNATVARGWGADNYHHFTFGLLERDGFLYAALSTAISMESGEVQKYGYRGLVGPNPPNRGTLVRANIRTGAVEYVAGGFRTPNGLGFGPGGEILVADNQGAWNPENSVYAVRAGRFYGHYNTTLAGRDYPEGGAAGPFDDRPLSPAAVALPQNEIANSPTNPVAIPTGPFAGQWYLGDLTYGGLRRMFLEQVGGEIQGGVVRFTQGFECGVNRLCVAPDGTAYIGGTGAGGNWSWRGTTHGLQRLDPRPDADWPFEILRVEAIPRGLRVRFTEPADAAALGDPAAYVVGQWYTTPSADYGGAKREPETLAVASARPGGDGLSVDLTLPGLRPGRIVHLALAVPSAQGEELWSNEAWYTMNKMPAGGDGAATLFDRRVLVFTKTAGFRHGSIDAGVAALTELGAANGLVIDHTEDAAYFNDPVLSRYDAVVFLNTTGDVLDEEQQRAFEKYIRRGGGFLGIHSATDTEYDWPWYGRLVGAYFEGHPAVQDAVVDVTDRDHPATAHLPAEWRRRDEWYNFRAQPRDVRVLAYLDTGSYSGNTMDPHPIMWCHAFDGGRAFYTEGGHTDESFADPAFRAHLLGALRWVMDRD